MVRIDGRLAGATGRQAAQVRDQLAQAAGNHRLARTQELDRTQGVVNLAVGARVAVSGQGPLASVLAFQEAVTAAGNLRDVSQPGELARCSA